MRVWLDPMKLAARQITADEVSAALLANNFQAAPGQAKGYFTLTNISTNTGLTDIAQFREMVVKSGGGSLVRLKDVATVDLGAQSNDSSVAMNGQHAVFIGVNATPTGNPLSLVQGVRKLLPTLQRDLPPTLKMDVVYDSSRFIQASIDEVIRTLGEAVIAYDNLPEPRKSAATIKCGGRVFTAAEIDWLYHRPG